MRQSQLFTKTLREIPRGVVFASHQLLLRGGFIYQIASGMYSLLPLGLRVFRRIENIIREEFNKIGIQELLMPILHPAELWRKTGRLDTVGKELWKIKSRRGEEMVLAMTHEETIAVIAANTVRSEAELPVIVNQFQTKVRDEERPRGGLLRLREFVMQDAYSFDKDEKSLDQSFQKMVRVYKKIFRKVGLETIPVKASTGAMGGLASYEFMVISEAGEDEIAICLKCNFAANAEILKEKNKCPQCGTKTEIKKAIEVGHAFKLGTKYSKAMRIYYEDKKGKKHLVQMGCYGIGLERVIATIIEVHHDERGIIWPKYAAPFNIHLLALGSGKKIIKEKVKKVSEKLYKDLSSFAKASEDKPSFAGQKGNQGKGGFTSRSSESVGWQKQNMEVLYDDRADKSAGEKFADCDLIGIPIRIVVSERTLKQNCVELKKRSETRVRLVKVGKVVSFLKMTKFQ